MKITPQSNCIEAVEKEHFRCEQVIFQAKDRWLDILYLFAAGLNRREVAERLCLSKKTVDTYKSNLLELCRKAWNMQPDEYLDYHFLREKFAWCADASEKEASMKEYFCCEQVISQAKDRWLDILYLFAAGLHPQDVAYKLRLSKTTVDTYKTRLLELCRIAWDMQPDEHLDYHFLREKFAEHVRSTI